MSAERKSSRRGRHVHKMTQEEAFATAKHRHGRHTITCSMCEKLRGGFCAIQGKFMTPVHMACHYGKTLMKAATQSRKWRSK